MFLSYSMLNVDVLSNTPPTDSAYSKVTFRGDIVIDGIHIRNTTMSNDDLVAIVDEPVYGIDTVLAANMELNLEAGSIITNVPYNLTSYIIRRKEVGSNLNPVLATVTDTTQIEYTDYTPKNNVNYTYGVYPLYTDGGDRLEGRGVEGGSTVSFWGYTLSDTASTPVTQYLFSVEIDTSDISIKRGFKVFENHTQFPSIRYNNMKYREFKLSTMPLDANYEPTDTYLQGLLTFLNNGEEKLLRTPSGDAMKVVVTDVSYKFEDRISVQPYKVSINVVEIDSV